MVVTPSELQTLTAVKEINPAYYQALLKAAEILVPRSKKYSTGKDPFINFKFLGSILQEKTEETFKYYVGIKFARALVQAGDFEDESSVDTLLDLANYALLWAGYEESKNV